MGNYHVQFSGEGRRQRRPLTRQANGKLRPLGIPVMQCRAMQALYLLALEPVAETLADPNSYGFRSERSTADAIEQCFHVLAKSISPQWVLEGNIKSCFDRISHDWLLAHIPLDKGMLRKWLKAGFMEKHSLKPTDEGTPQGGVITPPTMLQTLWGYGGDFFVRGRLGAVGANSEDDPNLFLSDFDPFDQGADNLAAGQPIRRLQTICDVRRKILKATEHERQFCFQTSFISRLLDGCFQVLQTLAQSRHPWFKLCFVNQPLGVAINQACYPLAHLPHLAF